MLAADLMLNASERLISILIDSNYVITGAVIEQWKYMRQMIFLIKQDIDSLDKKIDALNEQNH